jgi:hypothetical protein
MTATSPCVSFIVPAFNAARTLHATARSFLAQTVTDWQAIIVDDGSRDRTARIAAALVAADPRFRLVRQPNRGASAARNRGLLEVASDNLVFIDADDWIAPDFLERLLPLADGRCRLAYCAYQRVLPSGRPCEPDFCEQLERDPLSILLRRCEPAIHCVIAPTRMVRAVGGFDAELHCCEDWDLWLRLVRAGCEFVGIDKPLAFYRMRRGSLSTQAQARERAADLVMRRGRLADLRLPPNAPFRGPLQVSPLTSEREYALARELCLVAAGNASSAQWLLFHSPHWREIATKDPEALASFALFELPGQAGFTVDEATVLRVIEALRATDEAVAEQFAQGFDLYRAKHRQGVFGRNLSLTLDGGPLPDQLFPPAGTDALVLRLEEDGGETRLTMMPMVAPVSRSEIVSALLVSIPSRILIKRYGIFRSLSFWLQGGWTLAYALASSPLAFLGNPRAQVGQAIRAGVAAALGGAKPPEPRLTRRPLAVPILMVPELIANDTALLDERIGVAQLGALFSWLAADGYRGVSLDFVLTMRQSPPRKAGKHFAVVFLDFRTALGAGLLERLPLPLQSADVLLSPDELAGIEAGSLAVPPTMDGAVRYGLRIGALPGESRFALASAMNMLARLQGLNGDTRPVASLSERHGLDDAILQKAGFAPILSPASMPLRLAAHGHVFPAIECSGAEALGNLVECLRAA